jgi:hypothetical protein
MIFGLFLSKRHTAIMIAAGAAPMTSNMSGLLIEIVALKVN